MALPDEARCLVSQRLTPQTPIALSDDVCLCLSGIGYNNALNAAAALVKYGAEALLSWGVAGALNSELHSGDLLVVERIQSDTDSFDCSKDWQERLLVELSLGSVSVFSATLYSTDNICATPSDKLQLYEKTRADAVDMESAAIAELATRMEMEFIAVRAVADESVTSIPKAVVKHTDMLGQPKPLSFVLSCLLQPGQIVALILLARAYKKAINTLQLVAPHLKKQQFLYNTPL